MAGEIEVTLRGNLGADAEVALTKNGTEVIELSVACGVTKRLDDGSFEDVRTDWVRVSVWGWLIPAIKELRKGTRVEVAGKLKPHAYINKAGEAVADLRVTARSVLIVPRAPREERAVSEADWAPAAEPATAGAPF